MQHTHNQINQNIFVLCAGQGVVLERCAYSDFVFMETMHNAGYLSKGGE
jgi:NADH dehydrogenase (ubiquinone) 1 alpha subcomplex subunit 10